MEPAQVDMVSEFADVLQVGTRNMQNFALLAELGAVDDANELTMRRIRTGTEFYR